MNVLGVRYPVAAAGAISLLLLTTPVTPLARRADVAVGTLSHTVHPPVARDASQLWMARCFRPRSGAGNPALDNCRPRCGVRRWKFTRGPAFSYRRGVYDLTTALRVERSGGAKGWLSAASILHAGDFLN